MSKNKKVMSIAIRPELHDDLKTFAKRKGLSSSAYIGNLIEQAVRLNIDDDPMVIGKPADEEVVPVVLKIPAALKADPDRLKTWLAAQMVGIHKAMTRTPPPAGGGPTP